MDFKLISELLSTTEELIKQHNYLENIDVGSIDLPDYYEAYSESLMSLFYHRCLASSKKQLIGMDHDNKIFMLEIQPKMVPISVCGDGCSVNTKRSRLLEEQFGLKSAFTRCSSHAASGTIRQTATSETMSPPDGMSLYSNLRKVLKHFSQSPKITEI